jgi:hypothetical protein
MLRRVAIESTNVSGEHSASIIRATRIGELGTLAVTSNRLTILVTLMMMIALRSSKTSLLTTATRRNIPEDGILQRNQIPLFLVCKRLSDRHLSAKFIAKFYG